MVKAHVIEWLVNRDDLAPAAMLDAVRVELEIGHHTPPIQRVEDVDWLALFEPNKYQRLLQSYWTLLGVSRRAQA